MPDYNNLNKTDFVVIKNVVFLPHKSCRGQSVVNNCIQNMITQIQQNYDSNTYYFVPLSETQLEEQNYIIADFIKLFPELGFGNPDKNVCIKIIGPNPDIARIETSKSYCREQMLIHGLGRYNPPNYILYKHQYQDIPDQDIPNQNIHNQDNINITNSYKNKVIKSDGLACGKGVFVYGDHYNSDQEANEIITQIFKTHDKIVIEDKIIGDEFSAISFFHAGRVLHFPIVRDFKRLNDNNQGPNTGGMGTITYSGGGMPFLTHQDIEEVYTINTLIAEKIGFNSGFLYGSFIKSHNTTNDSKLYLIEYNARLGDSEACNLMHLLNYSLVDIINNPTIMDLPYNDLFKDEYTYFRYIVPGDYGRPNHHTIKKSLVLSKKYIDYMKNNYNGDIIMGSVFINDEPDSENINILMGMSRAFGIMTHGAIVSNVITYNDIITNKLCSDYKDIVHYRTDIGKYLAGF
jgi:phosphoribosylamine-glycine ligase